MRPIDADKFEEYLKGLHDKYTESIEECKREGRTSGASYLNTHKELLINIMLRLKQQPTVNEWIPCSEELPNENKVVLACTDDGEIVIGSLENIGNGHVICKTGDHFCLDYVVAWMYLPLPYEGDEDK